ncbi:MAG: sulfite exporter TauE/SafE family protein [Sphingomonadales bacterium]
MIALAAAFFATAMLYASVGFAGGSTYTALLVLAGMSVAILPVISLLCNLIVASGGTWRFARAGLVPWRRLWPMLVVSMPAAFVGGALPVSKPVFIALLGGSLLVAGLLLLFQREPVDAGEHPARHRLSGPAIALPLGLLSGIVGIGGGIFLAPVLHLIGWDRAKRVAASASVFILANSIAGLAGQATKLVDPAALAQVAPYWPLAVGVLVGGQIGSRLGVEILPAAILRRVTALLILFVATQLLWRTFAA